MFSNSTSIQLILVDSLAPFIGKALNISRRDAKSQGNVIVVIYTIFVNFLRWSIGFHLMQNEKIENENFEEKKNEENLNNENINNNDNNNYSKINDEARVSKLSLGLFNNNNNNNKNYNSESERTSNMLNINRDSNIDYFNTPLMSESESNLKLKKKKKTNTLALLLKNAFNIPFMIGVLAVLLTLIPFVKDSVKDPDSFITNYLIEPTEDIGEGASNFVLLTLGINLTLSIMKKPEHEQNGNEISR